MRQTTDWFTKGKDGEDLGVELIDFKDLPDRWHEICDKCKIPRSDLPHLNKTGAGCPQKKETLKESIASYIDRMV
jgi:hypothetical protein